MDKLSPKKRSENMRRIRSRDTEPELTVRRLLHGMGYRYRLNRNDIPGRPDIVFLGRKKVIFIHGCFWHQHSAPHCLDSRLPKSNLGYWRPKLERNKKRGQENIMALKTLGWDSLVLWECELSNTDKIKAELQEYLGTIQVAQDKDSNLIGSYPDHQGHRGAEALHGGA